MDFTNPLFLQYFLALAVVAAISVMLIRGSIRHLEDRITSFLQVEEDRENSIRSRERLVVAAALEGELKANHSKLEAFLLIYQEMLRNLKEPGRAPKYKQGGEIIHEKPALSRTIFDAYADRLELLGPHLAADLAHIYAGVEVDPEYKTLAPDLSADKAIRTVERIVEGAKDMMPAIEKSIGGLSVIVRDKQRAPTS